ncbi:hypothetical protein PhaeoP23_01773 [Phaeobacter piscinae]|uniref:Uncharacterized protein n=2 Tax=Phaeobacter piscinae TaxID=1580596 RepID=A0ABM6PDV2_9RHOB|nr:hypothetical protein PhaeoP36_01773 [Phaeobacter piscinae]ATG40887.1 hypothetical protein PhaeoP14_02835 [Phaeobacter piscinae]AUQ86436.1 hypothetical protein PhaeoP42_01774 [Phaeobacter piscinae]AUR24319.1 hypothetical protein PhaeoP23_01773 [Phaeobacter piscinae]UTS81872.1 hypothetical protein OL67_002967 [Phaeobacter piscinae]
MQLKMGKRCSRPASLSGMLRNFKQVIKDGDLRLHPVIAKLVDAEALEKMGALQQGAAVSEDTPHQH